MVTRWLKNTLLITTFSLLGINIFNPKTVNASNKYEFAKKPMEVLPLFSKEAPINYNIYGCTYLNNTKELDFSNSLIDDNLIDNISIFPNAKYVDLRNHPFSYEEIKELMNKYPHIKFDFSIILGNKVYDSNTQELDLNHIKIDNIEEFKNKLRLFSNLKKLDMSYSNLTNEELGSLREEFPNVQIDWVLSLSKWRFRTDVKSFSVLVYRFDYVRIKSSDLEVFKYCNNLEYLDLGHQSITDISMIPKYLPNLKLLILADNKISDITPLAKLTHLHYLELFINPIHDISALSNLKELVDVNLCYDRIKDFSPLYELPMLERIWLVGTGVSKNAINTLKSYHPKAQIVYTGGGSTNAGYRTHKRYWEMLRMFKDRYYVSPEFTKFDKVSDTNTNQTPTVNPKPNTNTNNISDYLNKRVDVIIDHQLGTMDYNNIYLTNYGHLKENKNIKVHILGEYNILSKYSGTVIAIIKRDNEDVLVVSNTSYSKDAINALVEYKEKNKKYQLIT